MEYYFVSAKYPKTDICTIYTGSEGDQDLIPGSGRPPGEEMATQSSILAWKISWTEKLGRLQSVGLQRVRHD